VAVPYSSSEKGEKKKGKIIKHEKKKI